MQNSGLAHTRQRVRARWNYRRFQYLESYLLLVPGLAILVLFFLYPASYNIALSFQKISLFQLKQGGEYIGLANYQELIHDEDIRVVLKNTVVWLTLVTVGLRLVLGMGLALLLNASVLRRWRLSGIATTLMLIPWVVPPVVAVATWKMMLHPRYGAINQIGTQLGLLDQGIPFLVKTDTVWWSIVAIVVWRELPFVAISFLAGLKSIPDDIYEAARVDGASRLQSFAFVTLPMLRPVIIIVTLLIVIWTYNNFVYVWLTTQGGPGNYTQVLATQVYTEAFTNYRLGYGATIGVLMIVTMLIFALIYFVTVFKRNVDEGAI